MKNKKLFIIMILIVSILLMGSANYSDEDNRVYHGIYVGDVIIPFSSTEKAVYKNIVVVRGQGTASYVILTQFPFTWLRGSNSGNAYGPTLALHDVSSAIDAIVYRTLDGQEWDREQFSFNQNGGFSFCDWVVPNPNIITGTHPFMSALLTKNIDRNAYDVMFSTNKIMSYSATFTNVQNMVPWTYEELYLFEHNGTSRWKGIWIAEPEDGENAETAIKALSADWDGEAYIPPFEPPQIKLPDFPDIPSKMPDLDPIELPPLEGGFTLPPPNTGIDFVDAILAGINAVVEQFVNMTFIVAVNTMIGIAEFGINQVIAIYNALNTATYDTIVVPVYSMLKAIYVGIETMLNTLIGTGYGMMTYLIGDVNKVTATKTLIEEKLKTLIGLDKVFVGGVLQLTNPLTQSKDLTEDTYQISGTVGGVSVSGDVIDMKTVANYLKPLLPVIQGVGWLFLTLAWIKFVTGFIGQPSDEKEDK